MINRPLAKFEDGRLWMLDAGAYEPKPMFHVLMMKQAMELRDGPEAERYTRECTEALKQFAAMEEAK